MVDGTIPRLVSLGCVRNVAEEGQVREPVNSVPPWLLP